jgi:hypothetical protein
MHVGDMKKTRLSEARDESVIQSAGGRDLISALAKLANPEERSLLLGSSELISRRPYESKY